MAASVVPVAVFADGSLPSLDNGGLIPAGLVTWLLPVGAAFSAIAFVVIDRRLRAR